MEEAITHQIIVVGRAFEEDSTTRSASSRVREALGMGSISAETLKNGLTNITENLSLALEGMNATLNNYELQEITVKLEVSITGQVAILGSGVSTAGTGGLELKFIKRK